MSSQRGNVDRKRAQKYQNSTKFKNDMHDTTILTKVLNEIDLAGVCPRCKGVLEWKIKYKKFKPLTVPKKCTRCEMKTVKRAYHTLCEPCATKANVCGKCRLPNDEIEGPKPTAAQRLSNEMKLQQDLKNLSERKRRQHFISNFTWMRHSQLPECRQQNGTFSKRTVLRCLKKQGNSEDPCAMDDEKLAKLMADVQNNLTLSEDGWEDDDFTDEESSD